MIRFPEARGDGSIGRLETRVWFGGRNVNTTVGFRQRPIETAVFEKHQFGVAVLNIPSKVGGLLASRGGLIQVDVIDGAV